MSVNVCYLYEKDGVFRCTACNTVITKPVKNCPTCDYIFHGFGVSGRLGMPPLQRLRFMTGDRVVPEKIGQAEITHGPDGVFCCSGCGAVFRRPIAKCRWCKAQITNYKYVSDIMKDSELARLKPSDLLTAMVNRTYLSLENAHLFRKKSIHIHGVPETTVIKSKNLANAKNVPISKFYRDAITTAITPNNWQPGNTVTIQLEIVAPMGDDVYHCRIPGTDQQLAVKKC